MWFGQCGQLGQQSLGQQLIDGVAAAATGTNTNANARLRARMIFMVPV